MKNLIKVPFILSISFCLLFCVDGFYKKTLDILDRLPKDKIYLILITEYPGIKEITEVVGLEGKYGHIEVIWNNTVYGARPSTCKKLTFPEFIEKYHGFEYEIREITIPGNFNNALTFYENEVEGRSYDLYYRSCTSIINDMYESSSGEKIPIESINVEELYNNDNRVREFMEEKGFKIPTTDVWLPDQFKTFGAFINAGIFN